MKQLQAAGLLVLALLSLSAAAQGAGTADTILINGKIATVDDRFTMAQALAIKDRRIIASGSNDGTVILRALQDLEPINRQALQDARIP